MARRYQNEQQGSAWGGLLVLPLMLGFGYFVTGDAKPLVNTLTMSADERERIESSVTYSGCNEVRRLGKAPLYQGEPGYRDTMDGDSDGIACENY